MTWLTNACASPCPNRFALPVRARLREDDIQGVPLREDAAPGDAQGQQAFSEHEDGPGALLQDGHVAGRPERRIEQHHADLPPRFVIGRGACMRCMMTIVLRIPHQVVGCPEYRP